LQVPDDDLVRIIDFNNAEEAIKHNFEVPDYLDKSKPVRYIKLCELDCGMPCGGTHVRHIKEIGKVECTKISKKGQKIRASYKLID